MGIREKCFMYTDLKSDQITVMEKMMEHFPFLEHYYTDMTLAIKGRHGHMVLITSGANAEIVSYDHQSVSPWFDTRKGFLFSNQDQVKRVPFYMDQDQIMGMVAYREKSPGTGNSLDRLGDLCRRLPGDFYPKDYLVPDGLVIYDAKGSPQYENFIAESMLKRLGYSGMSLPGLARALNLSEELKRFMSRPAFLGTFLQIKQFDVGIVLNPLFSGGEFLGVLLIISDFTLIKKKEKELMEKSTVIKEIHHRVKNNLQTITSLLRLQMRRTNYKLAEKVFTESINRILSIAMIHEALSKQDLEVINIKQTSYNIMQMILSNMVDPTKEIRGEVTGDDIYLTATAASSISLCITELIQNALEHAFVNRIEGDIRVSVEQSKDYIHITVKDNGIGVAPGKIENESSLGMQIVNTIIQHNLKGEFTVEGQRYGTVARISFPKSNIKVVEM